ncbi:ATP-dependent Clp protease proteolytic subunit [Mucilaginibacter sp. 10I4]|uniref:Clp protease ClpP n=1 Tax=Mucilaginibacter sp. 10I4 TaxID=3048580 RepID=UPI002B228F97|nr:ATP-dependent Clp protease proteolytic subunit [Mucilaginibacter sp. 10I4]MEB0264076.1 ATP-dependent Clp protease proteolytic subunit [Mucilaginibacter sp. 10I4]
MDFQYTVNPLAEIPIMLLTDDIGVDDNGKGIDGNKFLAELLALEAMKPKSIEVWINSAGGVVAEGYSIYSAIIDSKVPVDTKCIGMAASIAAVIFEAGRNRIMNDYSWLMFHNPYGGDDKKLLDIMKGSIGKMIARSGRSESDILEMMKRTTYIYAKEATELGLADTVDASEQKNKKRLSQFTQPKDFHREVNLVYNKQFFETQPLNMSSKLITNKLGLSAEASEDSIVIAIDAIQNKAKNDKIGLEGQIADLEKKMVDAKAEYDKSCNDLSNDLDKLKKEKTDLSKQKDAIAKEKEESDAELDKMKVEKEKAEMDTKEEKAKNQVAAYAKVGRIKDEAKVLDFWTAQFMADENEAKLQIESLPLNKVAPVINKTTETGVKYTAGAVMAQLNARRNKLNIN